MDNRVEEAVEYIDANPRVSIASVARQFAIPRMTLVGRLDGAQSKKGRPATNTKLSREEETAICRYIDRLDGVNLAVRPQFITEAANYILKSRSSSRQDPATIPTVGANWTKRFIKRHNYCKKLQKKIQMDRQTAEQPQRMLEYFNRLRKAIEDEGIQPTDIWNMDETGFRIGAGKDQLVVTKRDRQHYFGLPENRESATSVEAISAAGEHIPAFVILSGQLHMARWFQPELDEDLVVALSPTGYSNDQLSLAWIHHFQEHTAKRTQGRRRLLILDGHGSHHTIEFIKYCEKHEIVPFGLPPHLTHILQPLDVVVFQPLKHYYSKELDIMVRDGLTNISKIEFLQCIQQARRQAFKKATISSAFKKTGIWPFNPQVVLDVLQQRVPQRTPSPSTEQCRQDQGSSPFQTPHTLRQLNKVADVLTEELCDDDFDHRFRYNLGRFIRGSLTQATELVQTRRDLSRTRYAEYVQNRRRVMKNTPLKAGGLITVKEARRMAQKRQEAEQAKILAAAEAAERRKQQRHQRIAFEAAKKARRWRNEGILRPVEIRDAHGKLKSLRRF